MGKNQHQKDKIHLTSTEWRRDFGGFKNRKAPRILPLPFNCCSLSLAPFKKAVCTNGGQVFDKKNIQSYLKKHRMNPVTGLPMSEKDLFSLNFHRNEKKKLHCPLTFKVFNEHSYIVAIKPSGNVYSFEAVKKLNIEPQIWKDILTGEPFLKKDIVVLQNPHKLESREISKFAHIKQNHSFESIEKGISEFSALRRTVNSIVKNTETNVKPQNFNGKRLPKNRPAQSSNKPRSKIHSTSQMSAGFTSTAMDPVCTTEMRTLTEKEIREAMYSKMRIEKQCWAFIKMHTSMGDMNFALNVKAAPQTCHNFLLLSDKGYYNGTIFHRLICSFMVQGGDPEGTGFGGECAFGGKMKDEISKAVKHDSRGVLSMANSGPNTNGSQFFITFGECSHLDGKHSVFGKLVGGMDTLNRIELARTDKETDEPLAKIEINRITISDNPFDRYERDEKEHEKSTQKVLEIESQNADKGSWFSGEKAVCGKVGKYLDKVLKK